MTSLHKEIKTVTTSSCIIHIFKKWRIQGACQNGIVVKFPVIGATELIQLSGILMKCP